MKFALVLCALSTVWLNSCVGIQQKKSTAENFSKRWEEIIDLLNQDGGGNDYLSVDLVGHNADELAQITSQWVNHPAKEKSKNKFFHEQIAALNRDELQRAEGARTTEGSYRDIVQNVLKLAEEHPTASTKNVRAYDEGEQIGFCFGRALLVHYLLLKHGVPQRDISKVFALGELLLGGQFWRFHIAMVVRDQDGFMVVDPLYGETAMLSDWMKNVAQLDVKKPLSRTRFYFADPRKFMPASGAYSVSELLQPELKQYFSDMVAKLTR